MKAIQLTLLALTLVGAGLGCSADDAGFAGPGVRRAGSGGGDGPAAAAGAGAGSSSVTAGPGVASAGSGAATCPSLRPVEGSACAASSVACSYDELVCACAGGAWSCAEPVDPSCPAVMPAHGSSCSAPDATECEYLGDECECTAGSWTCEAAEAEDAGAPEPPTSAAPDAGARPAPDAGTVVCPELRPIEGLGCEVATLTCVYDSTYCQCPDGRWLCSESVDPSCPLEPPAPGRACSGRADCDYFDIECECLASSWSCKAND